MSNESSRRLVDRRSVLKGVGLGGLTVAGLGGTASARPGRGGGPPGTKGCDVVVPDDEPTVQAGVDAASTGDTVCVRGSGGPYVEQVVVDTSLHLRGVDDPTIRAPSSPAVFAVPESGNEWEPVVFAYGGTESGGVVTGSDTVTVTVSGLEIDGDDRQPDDRSVGVLVRNVSGSVSDTTVRNMGVGGKETFGVIAYGDSSVTVRGNEVREYERTGIGANGDGGTHPAPTVDVVGNTVEAGGGVGEAWGPNGIQIGFGADGTVRDNVVADNRYGDSYNSATSAGVLVFASSGVAVRGNDVRNSDIGVASAAAENNRFVRNRVDEAVIGAYLAGVNNNKLVNNELRDEDSDLGAVGVLNVGENNKLISNTIAGFDTDIQDVGSDSKVHANRP